PLGKAVDIANSNHIWDKQTRHSRSSFLIYINTAIVDWHSKGQATIETGVLGVEFVVRKTKLTH
ncbi:hypothetical protein ACHAXS_000983, partial [Conticribra weissflogii]